MNPIDLHTHTTASDGTDTPRELIDKAIEKQLSVISITDHDTIDGLLETLDYVKDLPIRIIPGIEFSANDPRHTSDIHILGYDFDLNNEVFLKELEGLRVSRHNRNLKMRDKLETIGFKLTMEEVTDLAFGGVVTRAHFGKALVKKGYIKREQIAYDKYIGNKGPAFVPREQLTPKTAINMIKRAGGIPVLAHPTLYGLKQKGIEWLIDWLVEDGIMGIEVIYSLHDGNQEKHLRKMVEKHNLVISGGSDYHGTNKTFIRLGTGKGRLFVPEKILVPLLAVKHEYRT